MAANGHYFAHNRIISPPAVLECVGTTLPPFAITPTIYLYDIRSPLWETHTLIRTVTYGQSAPYGVRHANERRHNKCRSFTGYFIQIKSCIKREIIKLMRHICLAVMLCSHAIRAVYFSVSPRLNFRAKNRTMRRHGIKMADQYGG